MEETREGSRLQIKKSSANFEETVLPHLGAAYNLAHWLTRDAHDAEDVVQDACIRAFQFFGGFRGGDSRAWLLRIVRNTCYTWLQQNRAQDLTVPFGEELNNLPSEVPGPEATLLQKVDAQMLRKAMEELPTEYREVLVLRELEELSYKEIADIASIPVGTVMSRLARARKRLEHCIRQSEESYRGL